MTSEQWKGDVFHALWTLQQEQQKNLGLDPEGLSDVERERTNTDLIALLHEEAAELGRLSPSYKRHILAREDPPLTSVAEEVADVLKTAFAIAQLHGLGVEDVAEAFHRKSLAVEAKSRQLTKLSRESKLVCFDLDDVLADARPWRDELGGWVNTDAPPPDQLDQVEKLKNDFYAGGRFRDLQPMTGASKFVNEIRRAGYKIAIITARPQWQYKRLYADTVWWLARWSIPYDVLLFNKDKVEALYEHITPAWPVAFVEDHERNAKALAAVGVQVYLFDQAHNQGVEGENIQRVFSWAGIAQLLLEK